MESVAHKMFAGNLGHRFVIYILISIKMEFVAQSVRASVCGTEGRGFEPHLSPKWKGLLEKVSLSSFLGVLGYPGSWTVRRFASSPITACPGQRVPDNVSRFLPKEKIYLKK